MVFYNRFWLHQRKDISQSDIFGQTFIEQQKRNDD